MMFKTDLVISWSDICYDVILQYVMKLQLFWDIAQCSLAFQQDNVLDLKVGDRKLLCAITVYHSA
jgi:hypothetical protein